MQLLSINDRNVISNFIGIQSVLIMTSELFFYGSEAEKVLRLENMSIFQVESMQ